MSYVEATLEVPPRPIRERPIWYQVMYNLAAHQAHLAMSHHRRAAVPVLQRAAPSFFGDARVTASVLVVAAAETLDELRDVVQPRRRWERPRPDRLVQLHSFLAESMEPAAAIMAAGLIASPMTETAERERATRRQVIGELERFLATREVRPGFSDALVEFALERPRLSYRVHYNVACYLSGTLARADAETTADAALHALADSLVYAPPAERRSLATWARNDPSLNDLRRGRTADVDELLDLYSGPNLERRLPRSTTPR